MWSLYSTHMKLLKPLFGYQTLCTFRCCFYFLQKQLFNHSFWSTILFYFLSFAMCCVQQFFLIKVIMKFLENIFACGLYMYFCNNSHGEQLLEKCFCMKESRLAGNMKSDGIFLWNANIHAPSYHIQCSKKLTR